MERLTIDNWRHDQKLRQAAIEILYQLADDDMIIGFRDQEWLGLAPHIEEDVAFGSIGQEEIGHAAYYFGLLEQVGLGRADDLASLRPAPDRRNSVLLEQPNGDGDYLDQPHYDWAWTIVRHYLHDVWEMTVLSAMKESRLAELSDAAGKIIGEKRYHRAHQELWIRTMANNSGDTCRRLEEAMDRVSGWLADLPEFGGAVAILEQTDVLPGASELPAAFWQEVQSFFGAFGLSLSRRPVSLNGRAGQHSASLERALGTMSEVYRLDPNTQW